MIYSKLIRRITFALLFTCFIYGCNDLNSPKESIGIEDRQRAVSYPKQHINYFFYWSRSWIVEVAEAFDNEQKKDHASKSKASTRPSSLNPDQLTARQLVESATLTRAEIESLILADTNLLP